jgi:hypothetical protein
MIEARLMIEVLGKPKEVLVKTLDKVVETINERYKVMHKEVMKPKKIKNTDMYSTILEIEVSFNKFEDLFSCVLDFGPTFVEILEPKEIVMRGIEVQNALSDLISKLHVMSKLIERLTIENMQLKNK